MMKNTPAQTNDFEVSDLLAKIELALSSYEESVRAEIDATDSLTESVGDACADTQATLQTIRDLRDLFDAEDKLFLAP